MTTVVREVDRASAPAWELRFGARPRADGGTEFRVWTPLAESLEVKILGDEPRSFPLEPAGGGAFEARVPGVAAGADYFYVVNGNERPDPVSRSQPSGVHGPSRVVAPEEFKWTDDDWKGIALNEYVVYELHTGTFTPEGTFEAVIPKLAHLKDLGVTAVELMPVAEFPGGRNWGYDGAHLYAPQSTYGGPEGLKKLIDACHREGLAFVLDVVYNHLGPEGNYAGEFMPLYNEAHKSPWGAGLNFDGGGAEGVRHSAFRGKCHGTNSADRPGEQFVVCIQNHDQIANGYWGDRLSRLVEPARQRLAAALMLLGAPNVPMLFMGEEWAERAPFLYFTSHTDAELGRAVRKGREAEYQSFVREEGDTASTVGGFSDPQSEITFVRSKLDWGALNKSPHAEMFAFYRDLLALRRAHAPLSNCDKSRTRVRFDEERRWLTVERGGETAARAFLACNLSPEAQTLPLAAGPWRLALWTGDARYGGDTSSETPPERMEGDAAGIELAGWCAALYISE